MQICSKCRAVIFIPFKMSHENVRQIHVRVPRLVNKPAKNMHPFLPVAFFPPIVLMVFVFFGFSAVNGCQSHSANI